MKIKVNYFLIAFLSLSQLGASGSAARRVEEGNRLFEEEKYDEALAKYSEAQQELPDSPVIFFNIGDVHYRKGEYEKTDSLFNRVKEGEVRSLQGDAHYNLGNTRYREGKLEESLAEYKKAIELDSRDLDAKFNYELVRSKLQEQQQQKQEKEQKEQEKEQEEQEEQQQEQKEQQPQPQPQPSPSEEQEEQPQPREEQEMSPEDVGRLLDALLSEEADQREVEMQRESRQQPEVLKDW